MLRLFNQTIRILIYINCSTYKAITPALLKLGTCSDLQLCSSLDSGVDGVKVVPVSPCQLLLLPRGARNNCKVYDMFD